MRQTLLDNSIFIIGAMYGMYHFIKYYAINYAVIDTNRVHTAYFNIIWAKRRK